jgi:hypothetical protein
LVACGSQNKYGVPPEDHGDLWLILRVEDDFKKKRKEKAML